MSLGLPVGAVINCADVSPEFYIFNQRAFRRSPQPPTGVVNLDLLSTLTLFFPFSRSKKTKLV